MFRSLVSMVACALCLVFCVQVSSVFAAPVDSLPANGREGRDSLMASSHWVEPAVPGIENAFLTISGTQSLFHHASGSLAGRLTPVGPDLFKGLLPAANAPVYSLDPHTFCVVIANDGRGAGMFQEWVIHEGIPGKGFPARNNVPVSASQPLFMAIGGLGLIGMAALCRYRAPAWYAWVYQMRKPALPEQDGRWKGQPAQARPAFQSKAA
ncbi:MAG: hypothetical protein WAR22_09695 [Desulfomonilia bacterium]